MTSSLGGPASGAGAGFHHQYRPGEGVLRRAAGPLVRFEMDLEPNLRQASIDEARFEAALLNLVVNARDAMPEGGELELTTRNVTLAANQASALPAGDYVQVSVSDTGTGMSEAVRERAFEPFFTTKDVGKGSGLGLAQAYVTGELDVEGDLAEGFRRVWRTVREGRVAGTRPDLKEVAKTALRLGVIGPRPATPASQARLSGRLHSLLRDRAAISHHYDVGNAFYRLLLGESMVYSCAYWTSTAAQYTVTDAQRDKLDHAVGKPFNVRLKAAGYDAKAAAENIGAGYHTLAEAFSGWRDSPPHRANMLLKGATRMGIAAVYTPKSKYKVYWAMIIADPDDRRN